MNMDIQKSRRAFDLKELGMLNTFAAASVILAVIGLVFGILLSFSIESPAVARRKNKVSIQSAQVGRPAAAPGVASNRPSSASRTTNAIVNSEGPELTESELKSAANYELLGSWFLNRRNIGGEIKIYEDDENEKLYVDRSRPDGERTIRKAWRVDKKILDDHSGEYYLISSDGDLERHSETGLLWTAKD